MKKYLFSFLLVLIAGVSPAQKIFSPFSKAYTGFGACSRSFLDVFSFPANQAALGGLTKAAAGLYSEKPWLLDALSRYSAVAAIPLKYSGIGITVDYTGDHFFRQWQAGLAYGKKLTEKLDIGIQFNGSQTGIAGYGNLLSFSTDIGALIHFTDKLHVSLHIARLALTGRNKDPAEQEAPVYAMGTGYEASEKLLVRFEVTKEESQPVGIITGIQYHISDQAFLRTGFVTGGSLFIGTGLRWRNMRADLTGVIHPRLGVSPGILLIVHPSK